MLNLESVQGDTSGKSVSNVLCTEDPCTPPTPHHKSWLTRSFLSISQEFFISYSFWFLVDLKGEPWEQDTPAL